MFKENDDTTAKPLPTQAEIARQLAAGGEVKPAARFMKTGAKPRTASQQPAYKLRKKLDELDLGMRHPGLNKKWRHKIASPRAPQTPVGRGRRAAAAKPAKEEQVDQ